MLFLTILTIVGTVSWAVVSAQQLPPPQTTQNQDVPRFDLQGHICDTVMAYVAANHSEVSGLLGTEGWTGGRLETGLVGAETYVYQNGGWNVTVSNPVILEPVYTVVVHYAVPADQIGIPYSVVWEGTWQDGNITETNFVFAQ